MEREKVSKKIFETIGDRFGIDARKITENSRIVEDCGADSLDVVEYIMTIEDDFDLEISDEKVDTVRTIGELIDLVHGMLS